MGARACYTEAAGSPGPDTEAPERGTCLRCPGKQGVGRVGCACRGARNWPFLGVRWEPARVRAEQGMSQRPFSWGPLEGGAQGREKPGPASTSSLVAAPGRQEVGSSRVCERAGLSAMVVFPNSPPTSALCPPHHVGSCCSRAQGGEQLELRGGRLVGDPGSRDAVRPCQLLEPVISVCRVSHH